MLCFKKKFIKSFFAFCLIFEGLAFAVPATARDGNAVNTLCDQTVQFEDFQNAAHLENHLNLGMASNSLLFWENLNPATSPPARFSPCFAFDPTVDKIILFGGINQSDGTYFNDTWSYDVANNTWTELSPANSPSQRDSARMDFDPSTGKMILFAGNGVGGYLGDTWIYDSAHNTWTEVTPPLSPAARNGASMAFDPSSDCMILFGGYGNINADYDDTWAYDAKANTWTQLATIGSPPARDSALIAFDPVGNQIILFGGYSNNTGGNLLNDIWSLVYNKLDNTYTWTQLLPATQPSARYGSAFKFDPATGQILLFGGGYLSSTSNDTWSFDGATNTWTQLTPTNSPGAREFPGFAFNPATGQMILFGGVNLPSQSVYDDTQALGFAVLPVLPPRNFKGVIKKFSDNPKGILKATWKTSPSEGIVYYLLYKDGALVDKVLASSDLSFVTCVESTNAASKYQIVAVNASNQTSVAVPITLASE